MESTGKKSWSIYGRREITSKYAIEDRVGSGAYSDVYRARRLSDSVTVALKEVHDQQSAIREIEALRRLQNCPNIIYLHEYFWGEDEDAVLILEFLRSDLASVISEAKRRGISAGERKTWMLQILRGLDACHGNMVVHRDLKPGNLLIGDDGVLKLADFGQARILMEPQMNISTGDVATVQDDHVPELDSSSHGIFGYQEQGIMSRDDYFREISGYKPQSLVDEADKGAIFQDGGTSCLATGTASDIGEEALRSSFSYEQEDEGEGQEALTSCVGTRWFKAPELLYGSTDYGLEIDLWSLGCILSELLNLEPLFPGASDIDQISRIIAVLGNLTEDIWPGCVHLPDYSIISFGIVEKPKGLEACHPGCTPSEVGLVKKLLCYNPASRAMAQELLQDAWFEAEPQPVPISDLKVPSKTSRQWDSVGLSEEFDSDIEEFSPSKWL